MTESLFTSLIDDGQAMYGNIFTNRNKTSSAEIPKPEQVHVFHLKAWAARVRGTLALVFGEESAEVQKWDKFGWKLTLNDSMPYIYSGNSREAMRLLQESISLLVELRVRTDQKNINLTRENVVSAADKSRGREVFIIHGHDLTNMLRLKEILRDRFGLIPITLSDQPSQGRTIIEKFESEAAVCSFAFALLTPDDQVQTATGEHTQARPNVVFELGWFYAKLGRERVLILTKKGTQIHSDLAGLETYEFIEDVREQVYRIQDELTRSGLV